MFLCKQLQSPWPSALWLDITSGLGFCNCLYRNIHQLILGTKGRPANLEVLAQKMFEPLEKFLGPLLGGGPGACSTKKILKISVLRLAENAFPIF